MITWFTVQRVGGIHLRTIKEIQVFLMFSKDEFRFFNKAGDCAMCDSPTAMLLLGVKQGDEIGVDHPEPLSEYHKDYFRTIFTSGEGDGEWKTEQVTSKERQWVIEDGEFVPAPE